jgi:Mg-chelatase subunit ChlD
MRRGTTSVLCGGLFLALAGSADAEVGELRVEIYEPSDGYVLEGSQTSLEVGGGASIFGGVRHLDLVFVLDRSKSLRRSDPEDFRATGATGLVKNLSPSGDIRIGIVGFDWDAELGVPLTPDRARVLEGLRDLDRRGGTDLAAGLHMALESLETEARPDSTRAILLFTDGKSDEDEALEAMVAARDRGVVIHTLLLGSDRQGTRLLREIAEGTGGSFVSVTDPAKLPEAFLDLRTTGVDHVTLSVNGSEPLPARLLGGRFRAQVPLEQGENRIVAHAEALDGRTREHEVRVVVRSAGCGELRVDARRDGAPAVSLAQRAVEIVLDASNSMWGRMQGQPKISVAQQTLRDALGWLPEDLELGLRVYGHRKRYSQRDCRDSELLAAHGTHNRDAIRTAIGGVIPRGQTPLAFSIDQVADDFGDFRGEKAIVLLTDGIESCGGDPVEAARRLQQGGRLPVHVIGFGLGRRDDEDEEQLRGIAEASGGRFLTAANAEELREALAVTVGTPFRVFRDEDWVASGTLGADDRILLPPGEYAVRLETTPPIEAPITLASEESRTLTVVKERDQFSAVQVRRTAPYTSCEGGPDADAPAAEPAGLEPSPLAALDPWSTTQEPQEPETAHVTETAPAPSEPELTPPAALDPWDIAPEPETAPAPEIPSEPSEPDDLVPAPPAALDPWNIAEAPASASLSQTLPEPAAAPERAPAPAPETFDPADTHVASAALDELREAQVGEEALDLTKERPSLALAAGEGTIEVWEDQERNAPWMVVVTHPRLMAGSVTVWSGQDGDVARQVAQGVRETLRELVP